MGVGHVFAAHESVGLPRPKAPLDLSESACIGVGHCLTARSVSVVPAWRPLSVEYAAEPLEFASLAVAVGQSWQACDARAGFPWTCWFGPPLSPSLALGVCH